MKALKAWLLHFLDLLESIRLSPYSIRPYNVVYQLSTHISSVRILALVYYFYYSCIFSTRFLNNNNISEPNKEARLHLVL